MAQDVMRSVIQTAGAGFKEADFASLFKGDLETLCARAVEVHRNVEGIDGTEEAVINDGIRIRFSSIVKYYRDYLHWVGLLKKGHTVSAPASCYDWDGTVTIKADVKKDFYLPVSNVSFYDQIHRMNVFTQHFFALSCRPIEK